MKKTTVLVSLISCVVLFANCHKKAYPVASDKNKPAPKMVAAGEQIKHGKEIFDAECGKCHDLPKPSEHDLNGWNDILPKMIEKAELSREKGDMVRAYVISAMKAG